jgi:vacuolar-type H+-ATPase subunit E/Vma4
MTLASDQSLEALEAALRRSTTQRVETTIARARDAASARTERARAETAALARRARDDGHAAADAVSARARAAQRRSSTATVLDAEQGALRELHARVRDAVLHLREEPDYQQLLDGLTARVRARLGADARVVRDPEGLGGVIAEHGSRRLDYTLPALAELALAELGESIEELWR